MFPDSTATGVGDSFLAAQEVNRTFFFIVGISVALLLLVTVLMIYFVIKYRRRAGVEPVDVEGNLALEIIWTVVPVVLVLSMFYYGWVGFKTMRDVPKNAMVVKVTGQMWFWTFEYSNGRRTEVLNVPVGSPVRLELNSLDVIHSFYMPAFRVKEDAVPGADNYLWFQADKEGSYDVFCAEYCGTGHSTMITKVVAMPIDDFREWYNSWNPDGPAGAAGE
jgi:cytochrome c oxidase subunit 2